MAHAALSPGDAIRLKRPHLRPAEAEAEPDRVIDLLGRRDAIVDEPQGLPPHRLEQAIGNERVDFLADVKRVHAERPVRVHCPVDRSERRLVTADNFDEWQEVHRVEGVRHDESFRVIHRRREVRWLIARRRRCNERVELSGIINLGERAVLDVDPLWYRFLNEACPVDSLGNRVDDGE